MLKRNSQFTLIELIVVIVVLGILAAIVIPNISSFQDEAREVQLTADARNVQTALDMFQAKSDSGTEQPTDFAGTAYKVEGQNEVGDAVELNLINMDKLTPDFLRKTPKYVKNAEFVTALEADRASTTPTGAAGEDAAALAVAADYNKGQVIAAVLLNADGKSTSIVNFLANVEGAVKVVR